ncbi:MAG: hypothetical protein AAFV53_26040 [Myxococcota bacterium]
MIRDFLHLLFHPDPSVREQFIELSQTLPVAASDALGDTLQVDDDGTLTHPMGLTAGLLQLVLSLSPLAPLRRLVRRMSLNGPDIGALLPRVPAAFPDLEALDLSWTDVRDLSPLTALPQLRSLRLDGCDRLDSLSPLTALPALTELFVRWGWKPVDLTPIAALSGLRRLAVGHRSRTLAIPPLSPLTALHTLGLAGAVTGLQAPGSLRTLSAPTLAASGLPPRTWTLPLERLRLDDVDALPVMDSLTALWTASRGTKAALPHRHALDRLHLAGIGKERDLQRLDRLPKLRWLELSLYEEDPSIDDFGVLRRLQSLAVFSPRFFSHHAAPSARLTLPDVLCSPVSVRLAGIDAGFGPTLPSAIVSRSAQHWGERGHRWQLHALPEAPTDVQHRQLIRALRHWSHLGMRESRLHVDQLFSGGLVALTRSQSEAIQAMALNFGILTRRQPWAPDQGRIGCSTQTLGST